MDNHDCIDSKLLHSDENTLFIIGNGFDLYHGVKSSYYDFAKYLQSHGGKALKNTLETCLIADDLWGNFEANLARLNREILIENVGNMLDVLPDTLDEEDDNFSYADFYASIDIACQPVDDIEYKLPKFFKKWVQTLQIQKNENNDFFVNLLASKSRYLSFNYTDFLETLYNIPYENIKYIHGCRKNKTETLILGHAENTNENFDLWYEQNKNRFTVHKHRYAIKKNKKGKIIRFKRPESMTELAYFEPEPEKGNWPSVMHYYAHENAVERIEEYFETTRKQSKQIISDNNEYFRSLSKITSIIVLGHSLQPVDYPYFKKIIIENENPLNLQWHISFYSDNDIRSIEKFRSAMNIPQSTVKLFKLP